jgi:mono/diheme cytochrome c family protein
VDYRAFATSAPTRAPAAAAAGAATSGVPQKSSEPSDTDVVIQSMLTMNVLKVPDAAAMVKAAADLRKARGVQFVADRILNATAAAGRGGRGGPTFSAEQQTVLERGGTIYNELCFSCHGDDGRGTPTPGAAAGMTQAPALAGSPRVSGHRDYVVKTILHGLSGPIDGRSFPQVMVAMGANKDEWVADVASYVRNSFGNSGTFVTVQDVRRVRAATTDRKTAWTLDELDASVPRPLVADAAWKVTASHESRPAPLSNAAGNYNFQGSPRDALGVLGWSTGVPQQEGMWFQVELPAPVLLTEVQFGSLMVGGGRGGPPVWSYPRGYQIQLSADGTAWSAPVASGPGNEGTIVATFAPASARFVRITQTATTPDAPAWGMRLLRLYAAPQAR